MPCGPVGPCGPVLPVMPCGPVGPCGPPVVLVETAQGPTYKLLNVPVVA